MNPYLLTAAGLGMLFTGAELLVRGSSALALKLHVRPLVIGLTVVAFGTSMPELTVSVQAALREESGVALGNVIGSNICNLGLILGLSALIRPLAVHSRTIRVDIPIMIGTSIMTAGFIQNGFISRHEGFMLLMLLIGYVIYNVHSAFIDKASISVTALGNTDIRHDAWCLIFVRIVAGLAGLILGSRWLVSSAVTLALQWGISQNMVGLTLVAVGTSLPELATSVNAAIRKQPDLAVGNVVGSNIFNVLAILGTASVVSPLNTVSFSLISVTTMILFSLISLPFMKSEFRLNRWEGAVLLLLYVIYLINLIIYRRA